jgi:hypothetical protein
MKTPVPEPKPARLWRRRRSIVAAFAIALVYGVGTYFLFENVFANGWREGSVMLTLSFLVGVPAGGAALAVWIADPRGALPGEHGGIGCFVGVAMLVTGVVLLREGGICVVMAAPIFIPVAYLAAIAGGSLLKRGGARPKAAVLPLLPLLAVQAEGQADLPVRLETVSDTVVVAAPPDIVWRHLAEVRNIRPDELGWTFAQDVAGIPKPLDARLEGRGVGAVRHVRWGRGIAFGEEIVRWEEERALDWRFRFAPDSVPADIERHIRVDGGNLSLEGGGYRLEPLAGGRTRVTLSTRYRVRTAFNAYCVWWGERIVGDLHRNVLRVIAGRAEAAAHSRS